MENYESRNGETPIGLPVLDYMKHDDDYSTVVYLKGALMFSDIRKRIGDEMFFTSLRAYYNEYAYQIAPPSALLNIFVNECQCDLSDIYIHYGVP
ncbi:MAG: hypothetical protein HPY76_03425 [Anaerolineae bacterium]|nr:hypothetical protein [Anaerolineae bacterium]